MIDIHSHIVFDVDDGPKTREDTRALLEEKLSPRGTDHYLYFSSSQGMFETPEEKISENFQEVKKLRQRSRQIWRFITGQKSTLPMMSWKTGRKDHSSLAETRFALIEFSMGTPYKEIHTALDRLLHLGVTPVVAHIERYKCLEKNEERVQEMIDMGVTCRSIVPSVLKPRLFGDEQNNWKNELGIS